MAEIVHIYEERDEPYDDWPSLAEERAALYKAQQQLERAREQYHQEQGRLYLEEDGIYEEEEYYELPEDYVSQTSIGTASLFGVFGSAFVSITALAVLVGASTLSPAAIIGFVGAALLGACLIFFLLNFLPWHDFLNLHAPHLAGLWASAFLGAAATLCLTAMMFGFFSVFAGNSKPLLDYFQTSEAVQPRKSFPTARIPTPDLTNATTQNNTIAIAPNNNDLDASSTSATSSVAKRSSGLLTVKHKSPGLSQYLRRQPAQAQPALRVKPSGSNRPVAILEEEQGLNSTAAPRKKPTKLKKAKAKPNRNDPEIKKAKKTIKEVDQLLKESDELLGDIQVIY